MNIGGDDPAPAVCRGDDVRLLGRRPGAAEMDLNVELLRIGDVDVAAGIGRRQRTAAAGLATTATTARLSAGARRLEAQPIKRGGKNRINQCIVNAGISVVLQSEVMKIESFG